MFKDAKTLEELRVITPKLSGLSYCIVVRNENNEIEIHKREDQPCIGGEHRKYKASHGDDCTRPQDYRPGDLHWPFPKGTPVALSYKHRVYNTQKELIEFILSDESPWIKGFRGQKYIEFIPSKKKDVAYDGWIVKTAVLDPTVWINCLKFIKEASHTVFNQLQKHGMSKKEAITCMTLMSLRDIPKILGHILPPSGYVRSIASTVDRVFNANPRDLTGGTLADRWDYNRPDMASVFTDEKTTKKPFVQQLKEKLPKEFKPEVFVSIAKEVIYANLD